jgi:DNA polymerase I-like protein with 3'-5' exonuclease and polymerase domains
VEEPEVKVEAPVKKSRRKTKATDATVLLDESASEIIVTKKPAKPTTPTSVKVALEERLKGLNIEEHKKPWMATKTFRLITTEKELQDWVDYTLANKSKHVKLFGTDKLVPVVAVDTETTGLDTRIVNGLANVDIAGLCLCSDGVEGLYVPVSHAGTCIPRHRITEILQSLFDQSLLVFFNAKFDREVLRITMGMTFLPFPWFEDVQIHNYLLDPKADVGESGFGLSQNGLKALSKKKLDIEQIELSDFVKVRVKVFNKETQKYSTKSVYAPFNLIPSEIALWYAAGDAITTWLLWEQMHERARRLVLPILIDHELVDTLSWIERQRYNTDRARLKRTIKWQQAKLEGIRAELIAMSGIEDFNPGSTAQLAKVLFEDRGFKPYKVSDKTGAPSTDSESLEEMRKQDPDDPFLGKLFEYREYASLHPENLHFDARDGSARIYLKQTTVAGGRLSANGGDFEKDGGCGLNIQAIKTVSGNKWAEARLLLEDLDEIDLEALPEHILGEMSADFITDGEVEIPNPAYLIPLADFSEAAIEATKKLNEGTPERIKINGPCARKGVIKNHLISMLGYTYCVVPSCEHCKTHYTVLKEKAKVDLNEVLNLRSLFVAEPGWTFWTIDYSNIEMRCAANISKEPKFINEFLEGEGDFHTLTAILVFGDKFLLEPDKGKKKALRGIAKILNFALLYGGTEHTIYENLKKTMPNATLAMAKEMVTAYWDGVPVFKEWVANQCDIAQNEFYTATATGRVIGFKSALVSLGIREPHPEEEGAYREYQKARKKSREFEELSEELKREGVEAYEVLDARKRAARYTAMATALWKDTSTGVRNYIDYNKFVSKAGRLSMNIPLQGLAGDFMRMALNNIRKWVRGEGLEGVIRVHGSVHDEVDPTVKNEYCPYVLPRIARLMKLRDLHAERGWTVPIETDAEYGQSWDIEHHLTGDKDHKPMAWTGIPGMETYVPMEWYEEFNNNLSLRLETDESRAKLCKGLRKAIHERAHNCVELVEKAKDPKEALHWLIVTLQMDEYWRIDAGEDPCTLEEFETFYGLTRPPVPVGGFMDPLPFENIEAYVEELRLLAEAEAVTNEEVILGPQAKVDIQIDKVLKGLADDPEIQALLEADTLEEIMTVVGIDTPEVAEEEVFAEPLKRKKETPKPVEAPVPPLVAAPIRDLQEGEISLRMKYNPGLQCLRFMDEEDLEIFLKHLGRGNQTLTVVYCGEVYEIPNVANPEIPAGYGYPMETLERIDESQEIGVEGFKFQD